MAELRNHGSENSTAEPFEIADEGVPAIHSATSYLVSFAFHSGLILILALLTVPPRSRSSPTALMASSAQFEEIEDFQIEVPTELTSITEPSDSVAVAAAAMSQIDEASPVSPDITDAAIPSAVEIAEITIGVQGVPGSVNPLASIASGSESGLMAWRRSKSRVVGSTGGTKGELAVAESLKWIARHQLDDGSWSFDHRTSACRGACSHPGNLSDAKIGATSLALLPFLGAGNTHKEGIHKKIVAGGLEALLTRISSKNNQGDFSEPGGNLYSHGLAAIVLCEAYAMSHDKRLIRPAQGALDFIAAAQDPVGGGWRYRAKQPGDTSVVGWQLMALKSGHLSYLRIAPQTITGASRFLDSVQSESGSKYGYTSAGNGDATTAIGLLCRMHLGWEREHPAIESGVRYLSERGPSATNLYYDYYAAQVLRHYEGDRWEKWDEKMSPLLIESQSQRDHEAGSWFMTGGDHGSDRGGRLYCTAMATMILEVYYRNMPLYRKASAEEDFEL